MKKNLFISNNIPKKNFKKKSLGKIKDNFKEVLSEIKNDINDEQKTLHVLNKNFKFNFNFKDLNRFKKFKTIAIIGMGGSILGIEAINNFLVKKIKKKIYFFDDLNISKISNFKKKEKQHKVLFIIISKSGNTIETLSNTFILNIIKKSANNVILISERKDNLLFNISNKYKIFFVEHKRYIGGRYSVLSEVGIIPAYLLGINVTKIRSKVLKFISGKEMLFLKDVNNFCSFENKTK